MVGVGVAYEGPYEGTPFGAGVAYEAGAPIVRRLGSTDRFKVWNVLAQSGGNPITRRAREPGFGIVSFPRAVQM